MSDPPDALSDLLSDIRDAAQQYADSTLTVVAGIRLKGIDNNADHVATQRGLFNRDMTSFVSDLFEREPRAASLNDICGLVRVLILSYDS